MVASWISLLASIGMAVGPPLVYADQAYSIVKKQDSTGFSRDVCAILLLANITRCFFWLGNRFELALLFQSLFMILAQLALLYICIRYRPRLSPENLGASTRPFAFWQWATYTQYLEFLAAFILCQAILFLILGRSDLFISILGFIALGMESTLPIPQLIRTVYFFLQESPLQFKVCSIFQLSIDCAIVVQRFIYGSAPPATALLEDDDIEQALALSEE
ncbi:hypothetical protein K466DRAFT_297006 [Polyporus arcularius HHB13444]|uniref:PQ-loop-domain-containing protein n=1 Tax=Polyporus arcularius HHB13444 TaxID=1314778 RepID=A0A5C3PZX6_9APHY|nr:hypothetical protein K466DRAFT_297006 [Polyporus arcularius HHB13444]